MTSTIKLYRMINSNTPLTRSQLTVAMFTSNIGRLLLPMFKCTTHFNCIVETRWRKICLKHTVLQQNWIISCCKSITEVGFPIFPPCYASICSVAHQHKLNIVASCFIHHVTPSSRWDGNVCCDWWSWTWFRHLIYFGYSPTLTPIHALESQFSTF